MARNDSEMHIIYASFTVINVIKCHNFYARNGTWKWWGRGVGCGGGETVYYEVGVVGACLRRVTTTYIK